MSATPETRQHSSRRPWELALLALASLLALVLSAANLGVPSLWHDELVHVVVARSVAEGRGFVLPSGVFYPSSMAYNALLGAVVHFFGDGAVAVRSLSAVLSALNVVLTFLLAKRLFGRNVALGAAFALALSPWGVAWAREARLYTLQVTTYLLFLWCLWGALQSRSNRIAIGHAGGAFVAYVIGVMTSFHSLLFIGGPGLYGLLRWLGERRWASRWTLLLAALGATGALTLLALTLNPNEADQSAVFNTGIGGALVDMQRADRYAYFRWLNNNLSLGVFLTVLVGSLFTWRLGWRGVFALAAFWVPVLILTYLIGYRRARFMFFAHPIYCMLFVQGVAFILRGALMPRSRLTGPRIRRWGAVALAAVCILFLGRLGVSIFRLTADSIDAAAGAHTTLARRHPQWMGPCAHVKARQEGEAILTTTFLPVYYYVGRVDDWFPNRYNAWEVQESGIEGLDSLEALRDFLAEHPRGYFLAEHYRFEMWRDHGAVRDVLGKEVTWVETHMTRVPEACSLDVNVYRWDFTGRAVPPAS